MEDITNPAQQDETPLKSPDERLSGQEELFLVGAIVGAHVLMVAAGLDPIFRDISKPDIVRLTEVQDALRAELMGR